MTDASQHQKKQQTRISEQHELMMEMLLTVHKTQGVILFILGCIAIGVIGVLVK